MKGFAETLGEDDIRTLFANYGEIESLKYIPATGDKKPYAFVCFRAPDQATLAKNELSKSASGEKAM